MPTSPIEHVVIIVKESQGFDIYLGAFPGADEDASLAHAADPRTWIRATTTGRGSAGRPARLRRIRDAAARDRPHRRSRAVDHRSPRPPAAATRPRTSRRSSA